RSNQAKRRDPGPPVHREVLSARSPRELSGTLQDRRSAFRAGGAMVASSLWGRSRSTAVSVPLAGNTAQPRRAEGRSYAGSRLGSDPGKADVALSGAGTEALGHGEALLRRRS